MHLAAWTVSGNSYFQPRYSHRSSKSWPTSPSHSIWTENSWLIKKIFMQAFFLPYSFMWLIFFWNVYVAGITQWLEHQTHDWKVMGLNPCGSGGRIFFSRVNFLCWLLFRYPFHPHVTAVARKKSRSSCQKCRWQVAAKHAYTLRMWLCMKWHVVWCTQNAPRRQQIHVAPAVPAL